MLRSAPWLLAGAAEPCAVSINAGPAPGRSVVRTPGPEARVAHDRCSVVVARGLEVSPCGFFKDQLIQRQVRDRPAQPLVLLLQIFHPPSLIGLQAAILLAPTIICCSLTAIRRHASAVEAPCASTISTLRSLPMISSGLCFLLGKQRPLRSPDYHSLWATQQGADQFTPPPMGAPAHLMRQKRHAPIPRGDERQSALGGEPGRDCKAVKWGCGGAFSGGSSRRRLNP